MGAMFEGMNYLLLKCIRILSSCCSRSDPNTDKRPVRAGGDSAFLGFFKPYHNHSRNYIRSYLVKWMGPCYDVLVHLAKSGDDFWYYTAKTSFTSNSFLAWRKKMAPSRNIFLSRIFKLQNARVWRGLEEFLDVICTFKGTGALD